MNTDTITLSTGLRLGNARPLALICGLNVLEGQDIALEVALRAQEAADRAGLPLIFKASFDKANRSGVHSPRGPGLERGLAWLAEVKARTGLPLVTDVHGPEQVERVAEVVDLIQIPAFLVRQTDLLAAACAAGRPLHLKKMQMMAPEDMANVVAKCAALGQGQVIVCERGTSFGYQRLIVDMLGFPTLKAMAPLSFDASHALQLPGALGSATGGRGEGLEGLALAGVSQGLAALFVEVHPDPARALCDGPCALPLARLGALLERVAALDRLVKGWGAPGAG